MSKENSSIEQLFGSAFKHHQNGNLEQAEILLKKVLESVPKHLPSIFLLGTLSAQIKKYQKAIRLLQQAIEIKPDFAEAHNNLGNVFQELGQHQKALSCYQHAIKLNPKYAEAHYNLGKVFEELSEYKKAISYYQITIKINPQYAEAHYNLGNVFQKLSKDLEAESYYQEAVKLNPNNPKFYYNLALAESELGKYYVAIANYKKALNISNDYTSAKYNLARLHLATENFSEGWSNYEIRHYQDIAHQRIQNALKLNQWNGKPFDGTLFVHGEQGVGDLILHSSMIADLYKIHPNICLTVDERLVSLFTRSFKEKDIVGYKASLDYKDLNYKDNDCHIPLASLGSFLRKSINDFPKQPESYIVPDPEKVNHFKKILSHNKKLKVGLSWRTIGARDSKRTISLNQMVKFLTLKDVEFINLQYGDTLKERNNFKEKFHTEIIDFDQYNLTNDFENLSALINSLDLIITISNVTAHFAGAIGKKAWVIVPIYTQWHWFHDRTNSPWYPHVTLFRQQQYGKWDEIIDKIYNKLSNIKNY